MKQIENLKDWIKGKVIKFCEDGSVNCVSFEFEDGTGLFIDTEYQGCNIYGPAYYEFDPKLPLEKQ